MDTREMMIQKLDALIADTQWSDIVDLTPKEAITIRDLLREKLPPKDIVCCKECIHRPKKITFMTKKYTNAFDLEFPDNECPCQASDSYYSWYPNDNWFCAEGKK